MKALIIEDEQKSREMLATLIKKNFSDVTLVGEAKNVAEGVELIKTLQPDLVFLDISMPDGTGFDVLEKVQGLKFEIIFTTATDKHALKAIKYSACDYLLKPIDIEELKVAIEKVLSKKSTSIPSMENLQFLIQNLTIITARSPCRQATRMRLSTSKTLSVARPTEAIPISF
jgi:two-component system LytT family response regulator